jgi:hypothetical protein
MRLELHHDALQLPPPAKRKSDRWQQAAPAVPGVDVRTGSPSTHRGVFVGLQRVGKIGLLGPVASRQPFVSAAFMAFGAQSRTSKGVARIAGGLNRPK